MGQISPQEKEVRGQKLRNDKKRKSGWKKDEKERMKKSSASEVTTLWRYTNLFIIITFLYPGTQFPG